MVLTWSVGAHHHLYPACPLLADVPVASRQAAYCQESQLATARCDTCTALAAEATAASLREATEVEDRLRAVGAVNQRLHLGTPLPPFCVRDYAVTEPASAGFPAEPQLETEEK